MAKKTRPTKKQENKTSDFLDAIGANIFFNERFHFALGFIILLMSVFTIIAMCSYTLSGAADQSMLESPRPGEWLNEKQEFSNYCGSMGAKLSYYLMCTNFGLAAFMIPFFSILVSLRLMGAYKVNIWKWFMGTAVAMEWSSVFFASYLTPLFGESMHFNPGGKHGMFCVQQMEQLVGAPGLLIILIAVAIIFLVIVSANTVLYIRAMVNPVKAWMERVTQEVTNVVKDEKGNYVVQPSEGTYNQDDFEQKEEEIISGDEEDGGDDSEGDSDSRGVIIVDPAYPDGSLPGDNASNNPNDTSHPDNPAQASLTVAAGTVEDKADGTTVNDDSDPDTPINPREPFTRYKFPTLSLLKKYGEDACPKVDMDEIRANNNRIVEVLRSFGVTIKDVKATVGPTITLYEVTPAEGVKIAKIRSLEDDIALCLSALGVRIIAPIPGKGTVGIEVPNKRPSIVSMESILNSRKFQETSMELPLAIGKTITNEVFMVDLAKLPHLLVAGATGQGKSVGLNAIITSLLYKKHPNEFKIVLVDPKKVEFSPYAPIADHFMAATDENVDEPIITDVTKVVRTLNSLCALMDTRYDLLKTAGAKNIKEYNKKWVERKLNPNKGHDFMPYIVVVIDEFGDLIMTAGKEVELPIARIAQLARAVGIHMIIATQRPTTTIITGNIKANFPGRMAFRVGASVDSKTILDRAGANQLIGRGDLLFLNGGEPVRVQCAFVDTPEIERINEFISAQPGPVEPLELPEPTSPDGGGKGDGKGGDLTELDPYFEEAAHAIVVSQQGSTSMIQRRFSIGYNRAGRLMDQLEQAGIVGSASGSKPRPVLITDENSLNTLLMKIRG